MLQQPLDRQEWLQHGQRATRSGRQEAEVVEDALRRYLGFDGLLEEIWAANAEGLSEDEAMELAYFELRAARSGP